MMKNNIDQIVAGSRSQYLAQVNGMPAAVTKHILKAQKEFIKLQVVYGLLQLANSPL
jgi:hypothetical protein